MINEWTNDIEIILENIRINSIILNKQHKKQYFYLKHLLRYFRLPVIIISAINSIVSVGLQSFVNQNSVSITTCLLALICSIIGSIELYLSIQKSMENELESQNAYYILAIDIFTKLSLSKENRGVDAKDYYNKCINNYISLYEKSNTVKAKLEDKLIPLPKKTIKKTDLESLSSQNTVTSNICEIENLNI